MATKIYIAGKITGDPDYKEKFEHAARSCENLGYTVFNPASLLDGMLPADYMRICLSMIDTSDIVAFLPGYETSSGAQLELQYCLYTDKSVRLPECRHDALICESDGCAVCARCGERVGVAMKKFAEVMEK